MSVGGRGLLRHHGRHGAHVLDVLRRAGGPLTLAQVVAQIVALRDLDEASGAVRA